ncbi:hypothetical protein U1Q18_049016 [Sarracenia purpurea var. burkii]
MASLFGGFSSSRSDLKEDKSHVSVGFQPSDQTFRSARPASQQSSRAPAKRMRSFVGQLLLILQSSLATQFGIVTSRAA